MFLLENCFKRNNVYNRKSNSVIGSVIISYTKNIMLYLIEYYHQLNVGKMETMFVMKRHFVTNVDSSQMISCSKSGTA